MKKLVASGGVVALLSIGMLATFSAPVHAAQTLTVTTTVDENGPASDCTDANPGTECSLREAVAAATADGDTIELPAGTFPLSNGVMTHGNTSLTIVGQGSAVTIVDAQSNSRVLEQGTGTLTLQAFAVIDALHSGALSQDGGAVQAQGAVELDSMVFSDNSVNSDAATSRGGAVYAGGALTANNSEFVDNSATTSGGDAFHSYGGALFGNTEVTVLNSTFEGNAAERGGAVWGETSFAVVGGAFSDNTADDYGAGIGTNGDGTVDSADFTRNTSQSLGGGVYAAASLQLTNSTLAQNVANQGGGAYAGTSLTGAGLQVSQNQAQSVGASGGGLYAGTTLSLSGSAIVDNLVLDDDVEEPYPAGGGIWAGGDVTVTASVVSGNVAKYLATGGGIFSLRGTITLIESTVANNQAATDPDTNATTGGGLAAPRVVLRFSTVAGNSATTGANIATRSLESSASVVAYATGGSSCAVSATTSAGYSYDDDGSCGFTAAHDTSAGPDPLLGPLADNGGGTLTMHPASGSPLVNAIPASSCTGCDAADQRGVPRPQGNAYDIGAVEVMGVTASPRFTG